jgi:hypothetical protein
LFASEHVTDLLCGMFEGRWGSVPAFLVRYGKLMLPFRVISNEIMFKLERLSTQCMENSYAIPSMVTQLIADMLLQAACFCLS